MLTQKQMATEFSKCYTDKTRILFIEKYLSTFNASAGRMTPFRLFPRQKVFLNNVSNYPANIAIKHRQCGLTTLTSAWICAQIAFARQDSPETVLCIGNKLDLANQLVTKIREFLVQVPRWYWGSEYYSPDPNSEKNKKDIFVKSSKSELELCNGCKVYARSSSENAARGISAVSILVFDEAAFIENGIAVYSSAVAASASVPNRKIVMISTPNGKDALYYETYRQALAKENNYVPTEFRWYQDLRYNKFLKWFKKDIDGNTQWIEEDILDDTGTVKYDEDKWKRYIHEGWTPISPWYTEMKKSFNNDPIKIAQELDVSFLGSSNNVVSSEYIQMHENLNVREPLDDYKDKMNDETWFWKLPIEGHRYICACDVSRGTSDDYTAIEIIDMDGRDENGEPIVEQVAEFLGKKLGDVIGQMLYQYASFYNNAMIVIDSTGGIGDAAIFTLLHLGYKNLYYDDKVQKTYNIQNQSKAYQEQFQDQLPGFHFQGNRYPVLAHFAGMVRNNEFKIRSIRVINELETWIFKGDTGRMDHADGKHDDAITCLAMGLFVMIYSINKIDSARKTDMAIMRSFVVGNNIGYIKNKNGNSVMEELKNNNTPLPFYSGSMLKKEKDINKNITGYEDMWMNPLKHGSYGYNGF